MVQRCTQASSHSQAINGDETFLTTLLTFISGEAFCVDDTAGMTNAQSLPSCW